MSDIVSKCGIHSQGSSRNGYGPFLQTINAAGRRLSLVKCRDDFGAMDEPLQLWPETITIGAKTDWDDARYSVDEAYTLITAAAARDPKVKYWEYYNERDGEYREQADLYIALLPRLAPLGIGLCMFNCASGTPQINESIYSEIARACKFAKDNGYKAILGLHEYYSGGAGTIERHNTLTNYLEAHGALIPIAITEYGTETYQGKAVYMQIVRDNDPEYMRHDAIIGCALWTLGGGAWAGSNYAEMLPELGEYIATVEPVEPPVNLIFDHWLVNSVEYTVNPLELTMPNENVSIIAVFVDQNQQPVYRDVTIMTLPGGNLDRLVIEGVTDGKAEVGKHIKVTAT